jgi:hypothetical protein
MRELSIGGIILNWMINSGSFSNHEIDHIRQCLMLLINMR